MHIKNTTLVEFQTDYNIIIILLSGIHFQKTFDPLYLKSDNIPFVNLLTKFIQFYYTNIFSVG